MEKTRTTALIFFLFRLIPLGLRRAIFKALFRLFYHASAKQRLIAMHNLRNAYPEKSIDEIEAIAKGVYRHMAIVTAELFEMPYITRETLKNGWMWKGWNMRREPLRKARECSPSWPTSETGSS
jgi:KDO2-lipid IV(A) lauroyltransferase